MKCSAEDEELCSYEPKPESIQDCHGDDCFWGNSDWSPCDVECGEGFQSREVYCRGGTNVAVAEHFCSDMGKLRERQRCEVVCSDNRTTTSRPQQCRRLQRALPALKAQDKVHKPRRMPPETHVSRRLQEREIASPQKCAEWSSFAFVCQLQLCLQSWF